MRFCVYGAGAVGGLMGGLLAEGGHEVSLVARGAHLDALRSDGLTVELRDRTVRRKLRATDDPRTLGPQDCVIVTVKAHALRDIAAQVAPLIGPDTAILSAMNGIPWWFFHAFGGKFAGCRLMSLDPDGYLERHLPPERVVGVVTHLSASVPKPGTIKHNMGLKLIFGASGEAKAPRLEEIAAAFGRSSFETVLDTPIQKEIVIKLWGNMSINPIAALTLARGDVVNEDPLTQELCIRMMEEMAEVAAKLGITIKMTPLERCAVTRQLGPFKPSTLQDMEKGRKLEIDALLTAPVEIGKLVGHHMPYCRAVLGLIRMRAAQAGLYDMPTVDAI
ncbi:MAG TPA: 2-dehydropantoate 2-reductase [Alphaproteobacteria bacterium]|nr:2-dehydropantoate 2-reductase [Alphaproteobacteria bacterium]